MTVAELIAELQKCDPELEVWVEDECCACSNLADDVMQVDDPNHFDGYPDYPYVAVTG